MVNFGSVYNYHPPLTTFPFALYTVVIILEVLGLWQKSEKIRYAAKLNLIFLGISVLLAFLSGYQGAEFVTPEQNVPDSAIGWHQDMGRILLFITIPVVALGMIYEKAENNKKFFQAAYYFFLILGFLMVLYTGYLGAELVFSHGAGVGVEVGG